MKSSKGKEKPKGRENVPYGFPRRWLLTAVAVAAAVGIVLYLTSVNPRTLLREGEALVESDPQKAGELLERSVAAAGGDYPPAQIMLCEALGKQGRWVEALGCFNLIKDKSALDGSRLMKLSAAAFSGGEFILAEQALEAAQQTSVPKADVLLALIPVRLALGREDQALADSRRLAELNPDIAAPHIAQARLLRRRDVLAASQAYRTALAKSQDERETAALRRELVEILIQQGNAAEARREFDQLRASSAGNDKLALMRAFILRLEGQSRLALEQVEAHLAADPHNADAMLLRGTLLFDLGEYERSIAALHPLTQALPFNKEAHYVLGRAYLKHGQNEKAKAHLETSRKLSTAAEEIVALEGLAARDPKDAKLQLRLAELHDITGRADVAQRWRASAAKLVARE